VKLLLIEDNPDDIAIVNRLAKASALPVEVIALPDGTRALDWLTHRGGRPDLILLDLGLPGLRGTDVLRRIRSNARLNDVPVIVLSGSEDDEDILEGLRLGAHSHIVKPIARDDFAWIVASVRKLQPRLLALRGVQEGR
jgi:CheY-like chemotaxis protein